MSKTEAETKEWVNIDYTNTSAYHTVKAWQKEGITWEKGEGPPGQTGGIPEQEFTQLKRLRKLDSIVKLDKGPVIKEISHISRQIVRQRNSEGYMSSKRFNPETGEDLSEIKPNGTAYERGQECRGIL